MDAGDHPGEVNYYLVSFATIINASDPMNIVAETALEGFTFVGTFTQYFEELMGEDDRLPANAQGVYSRMQLVSRYNPQRHIRIYGVKTHFEEEWFREFCSTNPKVAEMAIKETGVLM